MTTALGQRPAEAAPPARRRTGPASLTAGRFGLPRRTAGGSGLGGWGPGGSRLGGSGLGGSRLGGIAQLRRTSPGRLQLWLVLLVLLTTLAGLVAGLTATSASSGTADLGGRAQPLLLEAETVYSALADADATAAQAFLTGGREPAELTARYEDDLTRATTALTSAARRTPEGSTAAQAVRELATGVARYNALVATARATNRQGLPVGASYLATASELSRGTLQPQAQTLFQIANKEVAAGYDDARSSWWLILLLVLFVALAVALIRVQVYLSASTHRTFNVPLVAATVLTALLFLATGAVFSAQRAALDRADQDGSSPVAALAETRILVLRERAYEALTLAARAGSGPLEDEFDDAQQRLTFDRDWVEGEGLDDVAGLMAQAKTEHEAYLVLHDRIRDLDDGGRYDEAVKQSIAPETTAAFAALTSTAQPGTLDRAIEDRKASFESDIRDAGRGLGLLAVLGPLLALAAGVLAAIGLRARLEEYR